RGEPFLDAVGDGFGGADHRRVTTTRGEVAEQFAQGGTAGLDDALHRRVAPLRPGELLNGWQVVDGSVEVVAGVVLTREHAELGDGSIDVAEPIAFRLLRPRPRLGATVVGDEPGQDGDRTGIPAGRGDPRAQVGGVL